jgi:1,4-alpha-glucan branching enzyme
VNGWLVPVLHAHLPWVRHPEHPEFLEEDWLYEAITETYIPLLALMDRLVSEGARFRLTMTLSPTLCEMLADGMLMDRYARRLGRLRELADRERSRMARTPFEAAVEAHRALIVQAEEVFERRCGRRLVPAFRALQEGGSLEIVTCAATHAFLPHVGLPRAAEAQVAIAVANYRRHFGRAPRGIWLPECAYAWGLDRVLARHGLRFFFVDTHGVLNGTRVPRAGVFAPIRTPAGCFAFARDLESSRQVWSAKEGYPGDGAYREFYRDAGYDAPMEYIRPYLHADGIRRNVGFKYFRVTGEVPLDRKEPYDPEAARRRADVHAMDFKFNREQQAKWLRGRLRQPACVVSPYDAELFGHWWFEGPRFLESLFRAMAAPGVEVGLATPSEWLERFPKAQPSEPSPSSWGDKGYGEVWLNGANDWICPHQHRAEARMVALAERFGGAEGTVGRAMRQAARELVLAEASDWAFLMTVGTAVPYAHRRFKEHIARFTRLADEIERGAVDEAALAEVEGKDTCFPEIDPRVYSSG